MSMKLVQDSTHIEEFLPSHLNTHINECNSCRTPDSTTNGMKSTENSNQIAAWVAEEIKLKSLHRRLEIRIKRFLHHTRNSILLQEKLLNIEKCSQKELVIRQKLVQKGKPADKHAKLWRDIKQIEDDNNSLEKDICSLCNQIKQIEKDSQVNKKTTVDQDKLEQTKKYGQAENQLHRVNLELNKMTGNNTALRMDIQRMLDKRQEMIEEYNRLSTAMKNTTDESRQLTSDCSESFANRRHLVARMRAMRDQDDLDEKKLLENIRELDRLLESNNASKNFILKKSNIRQEQTQLNEIFAGKRSKGIKSAYTADEFRRLFRVGFDQDFMNEKVLSRTVETFLNDQEQAFALFEYAVELINELDRLREDLDNKRKHISNIFSHDNIESFLIKDIFATLEHSVNEANTNVQSLQVAKNNLRQLLDTAYQLLHHLFVELSCDQNILLTLQEPINDRNILLYLATIESRVQQILVTTMTNRKGVPVNGYIDDTRISWRIDHRTVDQPYQSLFPGATRDKQRTTDNLHGVDSLTPQIPSIERSDAVGDDLFNSGKVTPTEIVDSILDVYNECVHLPPINMSNKSIN